MNPKQAATQTSAEELLSIFKKSAASQQRVSLCVGSWQQAMNHIMLEGGEGPLGGLDSARRHSDPLPDTPKLGPISASDLDRKGGFRLYYVHSEQIAHRPSNAFMQALEGLYDPYIGAMFTPDSDAYEDLDPRERVNYLLHPSRLAHAATSQRYAASASEEDPLLADIKASTRNTSAEAASPHTATLGHALLALLKAFVGTGVLFLPEGFKHGGYIFAPVLLSVVAIFTLYAMIRLLQCRKAVGGSYSFIGYAAFGQWGQRVVQMSVILMQSGFCCTYTIFVATNLQTVLAHHGIMSDLTTLIIGQILIYIPLSWVRHISYFAVTNLLADLFIIYGLFSILGYSLYLLYAQGVQPIAAFNSQDYPLFVGTAVFTFEGIGLVIPTQASLNKKRQKKFTPMLSWTVVGLLLFYSVFAATTYAAFGSSIHTVSTTNLPPGVWAVSVQLGYAVAQMLSYPLFLFPVIKTIEDGLLYPSEKSGLKTQKNALRTVIVCATVLVAYLGQAKLDFFVAVVGAFCCVPLSFIYPPIFHQRLMKTSRTEKLADWFVAAVGTVTFIYVTWSTMSRWVQGE